MGDIMIVLPSADEMIAEMEYLKHVVLHNIRILEPYNRRDYYYKHLLELANEEYFFETYQVIIWASIHLRPKRILEIGTRNGGSLVQLLSMYNRFDDLYVAAFDMWREIGSPRAVRRNLKRLNIPSHMIEFHQGDSRKTVPAYKQRHHGSVFDYILVDGGHDREIARTDLNNVVDVVAPGGILIFDDIGPESYKLLDVWQAFQADHQKEFQWYEKLWRKGVAWAIRR